MLRKTSYNVEELKQFIDENEPKLNTSQKVLYLQVLKQINSKEGGLIFLDAPGGTGKTFLFYKPVACQGTPVGEDCLGGCFFWHFSHIAHRRKNSSFNFQIEPKQDNPNCKTMSPKVQQRLKCFKTVLIVWDECTMSHKIDFEALDKLLQDLNDTEKVMGGVTLFMAGDFRQILPVVQRGTKADELDACVRSSFLQRYVQNLQLKTNMRVHIHGDEEAGNCLCPT